MPEALDRNGRFVEGQRGFPGFAQLPVVTWCSLKLHDTPARLISVRAMRFSVTRSSRLAHEFGESRDDT